MTIRYSERARIGYALVNQSYNDIDVYVEDSSCLNMYRHWINRAIAGHGKITTVISLGDREQVLQRAYADDGHGPRPRIYLVDGDLNLICKERQKRAPKLYRLNSYCFENLLFDYDAIVEILQDHMTEATTQEIIQSVLPRDSDSQFMKTLEQLFVLYGTLRRLNSGQRLTSFHVNNFINSHAPYDIDSVRVRNRMKVLLSDIWQSSSREAYLAEKKKVKDLIVRRKLDGSQFVSGKDYLLPLLFRGCKTFGSYTGKMKNFKATLARFSNLNLEPELHRALVRALK